MNLFSCYYYSKYLLIKQSSTLYRSYSQILDKKMRIALIGQSLFGAQVYQQLLNRGHEVVGVFTVPDKNNKPDALAVAAEKHGTKVFKFSKWRHNNEVLAEVMQNYKSIEADLNVLAFCTQFIPMEIINMPTKKSIVYHPSILPIHKGASAVNWTLINGDLNGGLSIFWADDGLDTGPILLQKSCPIHLNDTVDSFYSRFLLPEGVKAMVEAVDLIEKDIAPVIQQYHPHGTYDPMVKKATAEINWDQTALQIHNFIRGHDKVPGAWGYLEENNEKITFYSTELWFHKVDSKFYQQIKLKGLSKPALIHPLGLLICANDGKWLKIGQMKFESNGKTIQAGNFGKTDELESIGDLTAQELELQDKLRIIWSNILMVPSQDIEESGDFFKLGASSMDVTRLVEEIRENFQLSVNADSIYLSSDFDSMFKKLVILNRSNQSQDNSQIKKSSADYNKISIRANGMDLSCPTGIFINNQFLESEKHFPAVNPSDESVICEISAGSAHHVDMAVDVAMQAFKFGDWARINARDRGALLYKLADLMERDKEQLATLESLDSGAVYTLALKTHIGMSIDTFRYFAGWCDKIQGSVIPINNARPNKNLTITKKEPIGVCGLIVPWNYPLMMLAWKSAACLAAGNTLVLKPAQVTSLTALKFAELVVEAGFPPGVINIIPGSGAVVGQRLAEHPDVRKLGFTGSTAVGQQIMTACAKSNLKKCSLELGGKSPLIIFDDCDHDKAVKSICNSVFFNKGENCIAAGRIFIDVRCHDAIVARIVNEVKQMKIGNPLDRSVDHGPQNHLAHLNQLLDFCAKGIAEGATLVYGGKRIDSKGYFMQPTIFTDVEDDMYIAKEESFGPIMIISKFHDIDEVIARSNRSEYGLASGVFTKDNSKALRVADGLEAGTVFINTYNKTDVAAPFGGFKQSGFGKDLGQEALNEYLKTKTITIEY